LTSARQENSDVDVRIGVSQVPRDIEVELADSTNPDELVAKIDAAVAKGDGMLWFTDKRGRRIGVPAAKLAYIELDTATETRRVGFGAAV
jgi:divalent metal cation (Fe/Co/Zn/Cd) transporter